MLSPSTLTLFSASAGSGKTHKLVETYLLLCLSSTNPGHYFQILAITFTRKATGEMKERIVESLIAWVEGEPHGASEIMKKSIIEELEISEEEFLKRSRKMLEHLLHHYGYFSVTTIDAFTHRIIRQFSRDLELPAGFDLETEEDLLTSDAVDLVLEDYGKDEWLSKLLKMFAEYRTDERESTWFIRNLLLGDAKNLLKYSGDDRFETLGNWIHKDLFKRLQTLKVEEQKCNEYLVKTSQEALASLDASGVLRSDFSSGTLPNFFENVIKYVNGDKAPEVKITLRRLLNGEADYYPKRVKEDKRPLINTEGDKLIKLVEPIMKVVRRKQLLRQIRGQYFSIALLSEINNKLKKLKEERNIVLMKELGALISKELREQPSAYIFERLGERYHQLFIDEFQDTSQEQWYNLQPFVEEIVASTGQVLLVGDAKQAIYRWRGGDVQQFMDIYQSALDGQSGYEKMELQDNYRSLPEIVNFNNEFFALCAEEILQEPTHSNLYKAGNQNPKASGGQGYVEIQRFEGSKNKDFCPDHDQHIIDLIKRLTLEEGYDPGDIAILYRSKKEATRLFPLLANEGFQVASEQGQQLESSIQVVFLINLLKLVLDPLDAEAKQELIHYFLLSNDLSSSQALELGKAINDSSPWLPLKEFYPDLEPPDLSLGSYELLLHWIRVFKLNGDSDNYLWSFLADTISRGPKESTDPADLLKWWNDRGSKKTVEQAERKEAIKMMTIHKSKGLQFPVVIVPNCRWGISELTEKFIWSSTPEGEFGGIESFPFASKKWEGIGGELEEQWEIATRDTVLDNLNLLYVAFTRPKERLYILTGRPSKKESKNIGAWMQKFFDSQGASGESTINFGLIENPIRKKESTDASADEISLSSRNWQKDIQLVVRPQFSEEQKFGKDFHEAASRCQTFEDWKALQKNKPHWKETIDTLLHQLQGEEYSIFFSGLTEMNERSITSSEGKTLRPDRIVIDSEGKIHILDYKTGVEKEEHQSQIREYQTVYEEAGYQVGSSKLLYI